MPVMIPGHQISDASLDLLKSNATTENSAMVSSPETTTEGGPEETCGLHSDFEPKRTTTDNEFRASVHTFSNSLQLPVKTAMELYPDNRFGNETSPQEMSIDVVNGEATPNGLCAASPGSSANISPTTELPFPYLPSQMNAYISPISLAAIQQQLNFIEEQNRLLIHQNQEILKRQHELLGRKMEVNPEFGAAAAYLALNYAPPKHLLLDTAAIENMKRHPTITERGGEGLQTGFAYPYMSAEHARFEERIDLRVIKPYPTMIHSPQWPRPKVSMPSKARKVPANSPLLQPMYTKDPTAPGMMLVGDDPNCQLPVVDYVRMMRLSKGDMNSVLLNLMDALIDPDIICSATYSGTKDKTKIALTKNETFQAIVAQMRKQFGPWFNTKDLDFKRCVTNKCLNFARKRKALKAEERID